MHMGLVHVLLFFAIFFVDALHDYVSLTFQHAQV